ncbi:MAG: UDP-N-acetylmuramate--L-alanine ligase, partial [Oscillospiraceae bacterium]|nr:UDP-N-acetylmuramate--L-alanine ligase [Oscillospiraceae bacterium]
MSILDGKKHIHMMGIGGSGMYPLAQMLVSKGYHITGSDNNETETLATVRKMGVEVYPIGQRAGNIEGADLIVYTAAILPDNPEMVAAKSSGIPMIERAELLGIVSTWFDNAVCVSGTHGKTTVTSMITTILKNAGKDISAYIGGKLPIIGGSGCIGTSDTFVCEACEFKDHYLNLSPDIVIINNIDADHLDYFGTLDNVKSSFTMFANKAKTVIANYEDSNTRDIFGRIHVPIVTYGYDKGCDWYADGIEHTGLHTEFDMYHDGALFTHVSLEIPGIHNVLNAVAASAAAYMSGASAEEIREGLSVFRGAGRRFDKYGEVNGITVCDDYGHHPTELSVTLKAAMEMGFKTVWAVFQPFTFSRTALLLDEFAEALSIPDKCIITAIMGSRETNTYGIYDKDLASKVDGAVCFEEQDHDRNFELAAEYAASHAEPGDLILTMGCGDINKCARLILDKLGKR